jgi:cation transport regulator
VPYDSNKELPESVQDSLPEHAQEIYRTAFNSAWEQYDEPEERRGESSREETAHSVAWSAVKNEYKKKETGTWVKKEEDEGEDN